MIHKQTHTHTHIYIYIYINIYIYIYIYIYLEGACDVMLIIVGNELGELGSNPE